MKKLMDVLHEYDGRVYVYLADVKTAKCFLKNAEKEGFTFRDGAKPTSRDCDTVMAINRDYTLNYVGFVGHMAYMSAENIGNEHLIKVDYRKLIAKSDKT